MMSEKKDGHLKLMPQKGKPKNNVGSLLMLFQSEFFTTDMAIMYLNKKFHEPGVRDFLINKFHIINENEMDFYLPEICYLAIKRPSSELEKFLYSKCSCSIPFYLKIYWYISSFGEANKKDKKKYERVEKMLSFCEESLVNGEIYDENNKVKVQQEQDSSIDPGEIVQRFHDKETRTLYGTAVNRFITNLIKISLTLKTFKQEQRKEKLLYYIKKANKIININKEHINTVFSPFNLSFYFEGICIPFANLDNSEYNSNILVRILDHDFTCFNTKKRVPYKIVIETVDIQDFKNYHNKNSENYSDQERSPTKLSKNGADWELVENELSIDQTSTEEITKTKINKYHGLINFAAEIKAEEQKANTKDSKSFALKFPSFLKIFNKMSLSPGKKKKIRYFEEEAKKNHIDLEKLEVLNERDPIFKSMTKVFVNEIEEDSLNKKRQDFLMRFPPKRIIRRNSYHHFYKIDLNKDNFPKKRRLTKSKTINVDEGKEENSKIQMFHHKTINYIEAVPEKPVKKRKLSDKEIDGQEKLNFIKSLREIPFENNETINEILNKIEESINKEINKGHVLLSPLLTSPIKTPMAKHKGFWDELWEDKSKKIQENSPYGHFPSYRLRCLIVKGGDDLRQELLAMQIIIKFQEIFKNSCLSLYLRPYEILVTSANSGILEFVPNTISLDGLKKKYPGKSLLQIYTEIFEFDFEEAQKNFIESLAAYSLVCYLLQIKDRHNGNILIDASGHIIHIDFGFMLGFSPGGINFESAPFKLTNEYIELMGGRDSNMFMYFKILIMQGFMELRRHLDSIKNILEIMMMESDLPCFSEFNLEVFCSRFEENATDNECLSKVEKLIDMSDDNWRTVQYDRFQKATNGISP